MGQKEYIALNKQTKQKKLTHNLVREAESEKENDNKLEGKKATIRVCTKHCRNKFLGPIRSYSCSRCQVSKLKLR